jgi:hypothetical protein
LQAAVAVRERTAMIRDDVHPSVSVRAYGGGLIVDRLQRFLAKAFVVFAIAAGIGLSIWSILLTIGLL